METTTIKSLFSYQDRRFKIPAYQRAYSWEKDHIQQFIEDLKEANQSYYLGHFLFEEGEGPNTLFIIDGQQRLTTCLIFFSVLHQQLTRRLSLGEAVTIEIEDIEHFYLRDTRKKTQKFETVPDDNNFFVGEVINCGRSPRQQPITKSQERIRDAKEIFESACSAKSISVAELERWYGLVTTASCTELRVKDKIRAAQIFAFQNDRGRSLSNFEILKSFFMLQLYLHSDSPEVMTEHLNHLEHDISSIYHQIVKVKVDEDDVLLYFWRAWPGSAGFDSRDIVKEIKEFLRINDDEKVCAWIKDFISGLANAFRLVEWVEHNTGSDFQNLRWLDNMALAYPFLIRARLNGASSQEMERLARLLENVTFRFLVRGGRAEIQSRLNSYLKLNPASDYVEALVAGVITDLRNNGWWGYWSDATVNEYLEGWMYGNRVDNYLLWRYELFLCSKTGYPRPLQVGFKDLITQESIEHIAPQTPTNGEPIANGYGSYEDKEDPDAGIFSGGWLNRLGNLMLISASHNSSIGNKPFPEKLQSYGKANLLQQQKQVIEFVSDAGKPVWDKAAIERRHRAILEAAKELWSLEKI